MNFSQLKNVLKVEHKEYQNIPFWSWNSKIEEEELVKQIVDMKSVGIGGFIMHARSGLSIEYLGEKWFSCIDACLKKAKELNMEAWIYDENGWPSGFVGGKLLENVDFRAQFLDYKVLDYFDENAFVVYKKIGDKYVLIDNDDNSTKEYYTIYLMTSPANTDILNPEVVDAFIRETHEKYYERFSQSFGNELVGFFTDEPQYYSQKTPYSKIVYNDFLQRGWDIKKDLIYLFVDDTDGYSFKMQYYSTLNRLYNENYYKKLYLWCEDHNVKLTGHTVEESGIAHQMCCCAGAMPTYKYEQIPCVDWLGKEFPNDLIIRQVSSVASQFGKKHILAEIFACCGYDVTLKELKSVADYFMFGGINKICNHLYPYSISSQAKFDFPPVFSKHSNCFDDYKILNKYTERLGFIIGETKEDVDVAIIHPIKSAYLDYNREKHMLSVQDLDNDTTELLNLLSKYGIMYHFIDESILESDGKVQGDKIICGESAYSTIIIPKMKNITKSTLDFLTVFEGEILNLNKEIEYMIRYAHIREVRVHVVINTLIYDDEMDKVMGFVDFLYNADVDAIIVQDLGVITLVHTKYPDLEIHASTQLNTMGVEAAKVLKSLGVSRVILARETSLDIAKKIKTEADIDVEVFGHGALCMGYSGQCLFSSLTAKKSGNRGECLQLCRLPYSLYKGEEKLLENKYLLSCKDLCTLEHLNELIEAGMTSLKLEGRVKSASYVGKVVSTYRKYIDKYYENKSLNVEEKDILDLKKVFNREFTKGYIFKENHKEIVNTYRPNNIGVKIGEVIGVNANKVSIKLTSDLYQGDGIRIVNSKEEVGLFVNKLYKKGL